MRHSTYGQFAYSDYHLFTPRPECGFTRATERHSRTTFPRRPCTRTGCPSGALPRTRFSVSKSAYGDGPGLAPNSAGSRSGCTTARYASTRQKLRGPRTSCHRVRGGVRTACGGWYLGWLMGSAMHSRVLPFCTGRSGVPNRLAGVSAAMISAIGKRWRACAVRLCIRDR